MLVTLLLISADLLMEFGSGSTEIASGKFIATGYESGNIYDPLEILDLGEDRWLPAPYRAREQKATYRIVSVDDSNMDFFGITLTDLAVLEQASERTEPEAQLLVSLDPNHNVVAGRGERIWFSGPNGEVLVKGQDVLYSDHDRVFLMKQDGWEGYLSNAVVDIVSNPMFQSRASTYASLGIPVDVELFSRPRLSMNCQGMPKYPEQWRVKCVDPLAEPARVYRHDSQLPAARDETLGVREIMVDYGAQAQPNHNMSRFRRARRMSSGSSRGRALRNVLAGDGTVIMMSMTAAVAVDRNGSNAVMCLQLISGVGESNALVCRERDWGTVEKVAIAYKSLQMSVASYEDAWKIHSSWMNGAESGIPTKLKWISNSLSEWSGQSTSDVKTVATLNLCFIVGLSIITMAAVMGAALSIKYKLQLRDSGLDAGDMTIEGSRRILAMSALTKYNCSKVPLFSRLTAILRSGNQACHLSTFYREDVDILSVIQTKADKFILLGGADNGAGAFDGGTTSKASFK